jgi:indole-3-glycerol phosphate synthase
MQCPLLCKEFVIDKWQIYYARSQGADAILLIAAVLPDLDIKYFLRICKELGMTALIEVHDEREMERVLNISGVQLIGINNRSLGMILFLCSLFSQHVAIFSKQVHFHCLKINVFLTIR